ncbi:MAG: hypothetical protein ACI9K2_007459, partial [Myxococcota bacterium]
MNHCIPPPALRVRGAVAGVEGGSVLDGDGAQAELGVVLLLD